MLRFTKSVSKNIDSVFVLAVVTLFAVTAFALVLIGAKQYRFVTDTITSNHEERILSSYLAEKIRQNDSNQAVSICEIDGVTALSMVASENDITYITYIYCYEGSLRELVVTEHSVFSLSGGQPIVKAQSFQPELINASLLRTEVTDSQGNKQTLYFGIQSGTGKEEL